jgi:MFS family permease
VYSVDWTAILGPVRSNAASGTVRAPGRTFSGVRSPAVSRPVWALGVTSLFTDISSEMVASVLPLYLVLHLGMGPLAFGVVDGLYQGGAALVRVLAGFLSDRMRRHKEIAVIGYAISAACRGLLLTAGNAWGIITGIVVADRVGKGIRTAPRDALISHNSPRALLATAFGVHRALDAIGAMLGPIVAFTVLAIAPRGFDLLFLISFLVAIVGVAAIVLFVPRQLPYDGPRTPEAPLSPRNAGALLNDPGYRGLAIGGGVLAAATISDAFVYLIVQRHLAMPVTAFPLLYVGTSLFTAAFAIPCGRLADRLGRRRVLLGGYALLGALYAALMLPVHVPAPIFVLLVVAMLGGYYAATDGVLTAMAAARLSSSRTGTGLSVLTSTLNVGRLGASVVFGWLWTLGGTTLATGGYLVLLTAAIVIAALVLPADDAHGIVG